MNKEMIGPTEFLLVILLAKNAVFDGPKETELQSNDTISKHACHIGSSTLLEGDKPVRHN